MSQCSAQPDDGAWPPPDDDRLPWTGEWPGTQECREYGWYAKRNPTGPGWVPCSPDEPDASPDLNRLHVDAVWDRETKRFVCQDTGDRSEQIKAQMTAEVQEANAIKQSPGGLEKWIGQTVKKGFAPASTPEIAKEWMWLEITGIENGQLVGILLNEPFFATDLACGDRVTLTEDEIWAGDP